MDVDIEAPKQESSLRKVAKNDKSDKKGGKP